MFSLSSNFSLKFHFPMISDKITLRYVNMDQVLQVLKSRSLKAKVWNVYVRGLLPIDVGHLLLIWYFNGKTQSISII